MFACIYIPNFPIAAAIRVEEELRSRALAIFEGKSPLEKIVAVDETACRLGISAGMTKTQAELCTELSLRLRSPLHESSAHAALLDCAQSFSPCVEDAAVDAVFLDLAGMEALLGSLPEIAFAVADRAAELGLTANVAVSSNPDAAMIAARGFPGVTVIPKGKEAERLGSLPIEVLFADQFGPTHHEPELLEILNRWGIRTLHALATLPDVALSERLGQNGVFLQQLARGEFSRSLVPIEEPMKFEESIELEHPIVLLEPLAFLLNRVLEQICARLGSRALATQELRLTLQLDSLHQPAMSDDVIFSQSQMDNRRSQFFSRTIRLPQPMLDGKLFLKLLQLDLQAHPPGAPIMKIHLSAEPARARSAQAGLFQLPAPEPEKLELTLARISGMVGKYRVGAIELLDTNHPDGFRMRQFVNDSNHVAWELTPAKATGDDAAERQSPITALRRFRPPLRADVTLENGHPAHVLCSKQELRGKVLWKAGPWRLSGDWWDREAWSRDEWDIALENNPGANHGSIALFRLVHDLLGGGWFVEGTYD